AVTPIARRIRTGIAIATTITASPRTGSATTYTGAAPTSVTADGTTRARACVSTDAGSGSTRTRAGIARAAHAGATAAGSHRTHTVGTIRSRSLADVPTCPAVHRVTGEDRTACRTERLTDSALARS